MPPRRIHARQKGHAMKTLANILVKTSASSVHRAIPWKLRGLNRVIAWAAATGVLLAMPAVAAPWAKSAAMSAPDQLEQVRWRHRSNGALVAGAAGLGIAAAAARPAYGYDRGYG